jgi:homocysteine S-methyltransferase
MNPTERIAGILDDAGLILAEAAMCERLRRMAGIALNPILFNSPLVYDARGRAAMEEIWGQYRDIARDAGVPILLCAPTWRADRARIEQAGVPETINRDAVTYMRGLRDRWDHPRSPVLVAGLVGPKNDCYQPSQGLSESEASRFHEWQARELAGAGVDLLLAQTMPAMPEARGLARAMAGTGLPYIISFVINRRGEVFDGTPLAAAVAEMDASPETRPLRYMVNCAYPTFICAHRQPASLFERLIGIQANSSSRDQQDLDGESETRRDSLDDWVRQMLILHREYGMKLLGGCCGTDDRYLAGIVEGMTLSSQKPCGKTERL